ncbi:hypothetical protein ACLOJK_035898 [Asimina triloba]
MYNFQQYRHIQAPGWTLGWTWHKKEVIWSMVGAQTTEQGDCSRYKGNVPHCCKRDPTVVDLLPGTPYNMQIANCCKGGVINSWVQDPPNAVSSFQLSVGAAGTSNKTVKVPKNFTLKAPGPGYTCGRAKIVKPTRFFTQDGRRATQALREIHHIWHQLFPGVAKIIMRRWSNAPITCVQSGYTGMSSSTTKNTGGQNYTQWNLVVQHPNFDNLTQIFSFYYKSLTPYEAINDTAMLWGIKFYNDLLMEAGPLGNVQSELLFKKDPGTFTFDKGWAFPRRVYFNGDNCVMPPPDAYPWLPNATPPLKASLILPVAVFLAYVVFLLAAYV